LYDGQGPQVAGEVAAEAGTTVVKTFVAVITTVLVLVVVDEDEDEDDQTPHVSDETGLALLLLPEATGDDDRTPNVPEAGLLIPVGTTEEAEYGVLTDTGVYGDEEVSSATGDVLEFPSQLPQDEDRAPLPHDSAGVLAEAACQLPQLPESPCLSRLSTTPAKTELAKASRTNELFTILAS
jgi:hypothetical protein